MDYIRAVFRQKIVDEDDREKRSQSLSNQGSLSTSLRTHPRAAGVSQSLSNQGSLSTFTDHRCSIS